MRFQLILPRIQHLKSASMKKIFTLLLCISFLSFSYSQDLSSKMISAFPDAFTGYWYFKPVKEGNWDGPTITKNYFEFQYNLYTYDSVHVKDSVYHLFLKSTAGKLLQLQVKSFSSDSIVLTIAGKPDGIAMKKVEQPSGGKKITVHQVPEFLFRTWLNYSTTKPLLTLEHAKIKSEDKDWSIEEIVYYKSNQYRFIYRNGGEYRIAHFQRPQRGKTGIAIGTTQNQAYTGNLFRGKDVDPKISNVFIDSMGGTWYRSNNPEQKLSVSETEGLLFTEYTEPYINGITQQGQQFTIQYVTSGAALKLRKLNANYILVSFQNNPPVLYKKDKSLPNQVNLQWNDWKDAVSGDWFSVDGSNKRSYALHNQFIQIAGNKTTGHIFQNEAGYYVGDKTGKPILYFRNAAPGYIEWSNNGRHYRLYKNKTSLANSRKVSIADLPVELKQDLFSKSAYVGGVYDGAVIYNKKIWQYQTIHYNGQEYIIQAKDGKNKTTFVVKAELANDSLSIRQDAKSFQKYGTNVSLVKFIPGNTKPAGNLQKVWIKGIVKDYANYADKFSFIRFPVNDPVMGDQVTYNAEVNFNGYFETSFPLSFAQDIMMTLGELSLTRLFAYPGDTLLLSISAKEVEKNDHEGIMLIGHSADVSRDIMEFDKLKRRMTNWNEHRSHIENDSAMGYLQYRTGLYNKEKQLAGSLSAVKEMSKKTKEFIALDLQYGFFDDLMRFSWLKNYYKDNGGRIELPKSYLKLITNDVLNNPNATISSNYGYSFLREYCRYIDELTEKENNLSSILKKWKLQGWNALSEKQQEWVGMGCPANFIRKNIKADKLTPDFTAQIDTIEKTKPADLEPAQVDFIYNTFKEMGYEVTYSSSEDTLYLPLQKQYGRGLAFNLLLAQDIERRIQNDILKDSAVLAQSLAVFTDKTIKKRITGDYNKAIAFLKNPVLPKGSNLYDVAKNPGDLLLQSIAQQFPGKVLYIDFWATWCGPCLSEMQNGPQLKDALAGKDVAFIYLCGRSPEATWKQRIGQYNIKGEHYLLNDKQWEYLCDKFGISGIPHYVLVNQKGEVIDSDAKRPSDLEGLVKDIDALLR
jgi:thiol-disulfide isomerase/thioredoxin